MDIFDLYAKIDVDLATFESGIRTAEGKFEKFSGKIADISSKIESNMEKALGSGAKKVVSGIETAISKINDIGSTAFNAFGAGAAVVGTGLGAGLKYVIENGSAFEAQMSKVEAISGATGEEMEALSKKAAELGRDTKFSSTEAGQAYEYMAMAGWNTEQMLSGVSGIMDLAAASGEDLASVSDIVTDALTAFGLKAEDSTHFADVLAAASTSANTNVAMMGETFKYAAPLAGAMGYSIEDTALAIGLMANASVKGSMAGTALRSTIARLTKPTEEMQAVMVDLGFATAEYANKIDDAKLQKAQTDFANKTVDLEKAQLKYNDAVEKYGENSSQAKTAMLNVQKAQNNLLQAKKKLESEQQGVNEMVGINNHLLVDEAGNMKSLSQVISTLRKSFKNLSRDQQTSYAATLFGQEAMSGMLAIINASEEDYEKLSSAIADCDGAAKDMAETMLDNLPGAVTLFKSSLQSLAVDHIYASIQDKLKEFVMNAKGLIDELSAAFEEAGWGGIGSKLFDFADDGIKAAGKVLPGMLESGGDTLTSIFGKAEGLLSGNSEGINAIISSGGDALRNGFGGFVGLGSTAAKEFGGGLAEQLILLKSDIFGAGLDIIGSFAEGIGNNAEGLVETAVQIEEKISGKINENLPKVTEAGKKIIKAFAKSIDPIELLNAIGDGITNVFAGLEELLGKSSGDVNDFISAGGNVFSKVFDSLSKLASTAAKEFGPELAIQFLSFKAEIFGMGIDLIGSFAEGIGEKADTAEAAMGIVRKIADKIVKNLPKIADGITALLGSMSQEMDKEENRQALSNTVDAIFNFIFGEDGLTSAENVESIAGIALNLISALGNGLVDNLPEIGESIKRVVLGIRDELDEKIESTDWGELGKKLWNNFWSFDASITDAFRRFFLGDNVVEDIEYTKQSIGEGWNNFTGWIKNESDKSKAFWSGEKSGSEDDNKTGSWSDWLDEFLAPLEKTKRWKEMDEAREKGTVQYSESAIGKEVASIVNSMLIKSQTEKAPPTEVNLNIDGERVAQVVVDPIIKSIRQRDKGGYLYWNETGQ